VTNLDQFYRSVINDSALAELLYLFPEREISDIAITDPEKYNSAVKALYLDWKPLEKLTDLSTTPEEFHYNNQQIWWMPKEYIDFDIAKWVLEQCSNQDELQRTGQELLVYAERNLLQLLQYLKYLVDTMKSNNIVWGVGRGSSVASFVLYLIGVHRIHSLKYNLNFDEFMR
jgi:DNA polymerase III alpha subunit